MTAVRSLPLLLAALVGASASTSAQATAAPDSACSYDACALRVERRLGATLVVRGARGERVATVGLFAPDLAPHLARSDSAVRYARAFRRDHARGGLLRVAGVVSATAAFADGGLADHRRSDFAPPTRGVRAAVFWTGLAAGLVGAHLERRADRSLAQALWWYNRELPR